jgi:phosphodiesterase/alkaline phosphatase D-like protein
MDSRFLLTGLFLLLFSAGIAQTPLPLASGYIIPNGPGDPQFYQDMVQSGNYIYGISNVGDELIVVDVSDPAAPEIVANVEDGVGGVTMDGPRAIAVSGNFAYIVSQQSLSLEILNISDPLNPTHVGTLVDVNEESPTDPGATGPFLAFPSGIVVNGNYAYISTYYGLEIVDITNPASPTHVSNLYEVATVEAPFVEYLEFLQGIAIAGNYAYVVRNVGGGARFTTIDISNPAAPARVGSVNHAAAGPLLTNAQDIAVVGSYAYVISDNNALEILDISTPAAPAHHAFIKHNNALGIRMDGPRGLAIQGQYAYIISHNSSAVEVIDINNPGTPAHVTNIQNGEEGNPPHMGSGKCIIVSGNFAYIGAHGFQILSIFTPGPPEVDKGVFLIDDEIDFSTSFRFRWKNTTGLSYTLEVSTDDFVTRIPGYDGVAVTGTTAQGSPLGWLQSHVTGLTPNTTYKYRMKAVNANGPSDPSAPITITTAPPAPVATAATSVAFSSFIVNWEAVAGATNYYLYLYDQGSLGFPNSHFTGYPMGNVTSFELSGGSAGILPASNYIYRIKAINTNGSSPMSNQISLTTVPYYTTFKPATSIEKTSFNANWNADPGSLAVVTGYFLDVATDEAFTQLLTGYDNLDVGNVTTKLVEGLTAGTTYYYRVRTANNTGQSPNSPEEITVTTVPPEPTINAATSVTTLGFTASWNAAPGATSYRIDVSTNTGFTSFVPLYNDRLAPVTPTTLDVTGLVAGTTYFYRVRAVNAGGTSGTLGVTEVITLPVAPATATTTLVGQSGFTANWNAVTGAAHYFIDVSTDPLFATFVTGFNNTQVNALTQSIGGLQPNTTYHYRVRAANASGSSVSSSVVIVLTAPTAPVALAASGPTQTSFVANWNAVDNATGYKVDVSSQETFPSFVAGFQDATATSTSLDITGLASGTTYFYRVRATNGSGASNASNIVSQITIPATPTIPVTGAVSAVGQTSFTINWNAATGAVEYFVDVKDVGGNNLQGYSNVSTTATSVAVTNGITAGTSYQYIVRAANSAGTSPSSATQSVLTVPATPIAAEAESITATAFTAKWSAATGATKYQLSVATESTFALSSIVSVYNNLDVGNVTSFTVNVSSAPSTIYFYKVIAVNGSGNSPASESITVTPLITSFPSILLPTGGQATHYRVISIPTGTVASTALASESFGQRWRVMHYDGESNKDVPNVSAIEPGLGYWVNSNLDQAPSITVEGSFTASTKTMTLRPGWNQIGNPFNFSISWADVLARNSTVTNVGDLYIYTGNFTGVTDFSHLVVDLSTIPDHPMLRCQFLSTPRALMAERKPEDLKLKNVISPGKNGFCPFT